MPLLKQSQASWRKRFVMSRSPALKTPAGIPSVPGALPALTALTVSSTSFRFSRARPSCRWLQGRHKCCESRGHASAPRSVTVGPPFSPIALTFRRRLWLRSTASSWPGGLFDTLIHGAQVSVVESRLHVFGYCSPIVVCRMPQGSTRVLLCWLQCIECLSSCVTFEANEDFSFPLKAAFGERVFVPPGCYPKASFAHL